MKILLINPPYTNFEGMKESGGHTMPLNLAYLAGYLREKVDCQIKILDTETLGLDYKEIEESIRKENPDVAGFTCLSPTINHVFRMCQIIKEDLELDCATVVGGTHPTILPKEILKNPYIDFAVISEGEVTFAELVKAIKEKRTDFEKINGLYYKKNEQILKTPDREFIANLDEIPFPARDLFDLKLYYSAPTKKLTSEQCSPLLTSRGCAYDCIHCVSKSIWKRRLRYRSAENIIAEIEECIDKYNVKEFNILDDNFTLNKAQAMKVCQKIIDKKLPIAWICFSRADAIDDELADLMARAGCKKISIGLESGSQKVLNLMRKGTTLEQGRKIVETITRHGIQAHASFMLGNIGETKETIRETIDLAKSLDLDNATFFITCPVPGSDLYNYAKSQGLIPDNTPWEMFAPLTDAPPVLAQENLSQDDLVYWQKKAFREFYLRPKYIIRKLRQMNSWDAIKSVAEGVRVLIRILFKPKPNNEKTLKKYSFLIGFLLFALIIYQLDLGVLAWAFKKINYQILPLAFLLVIPLILTKAWRWNYLKKLQSINYRLSDSFLMYGVGLAIGSLTPGRLGEISKIVYLKNDAHSTGQSLVSVVMDRLLDLFYLVIFGYLGIIFFFGFFKKITLIYSLIILSIIAIIFIVRKRFYNQLIKKVFSIVIPEKYQKSWRINFQDFWQGLKIYNKKNYLYFFLITLLAWLIYYIQIYLFAKSIGLNEIPVFHLIMAVTVSGFITLLPLSFLGIGTREATLMVMLSPLMVNLEVIILLSELILLDFFVMGIIGAICWNLKPLPLAQIFSTKRPIKSK